MDLPWTDLGVPVWCTNIPVGMTVQTAATGFGFLFVFACVLERERDLAGISTKWFTGTFESSAIKTY